jgi:N-acetylglucosaminyldiphosphoundecaprenol N-acetyl-beta-D-mannosaminyltransferase
VAPVNPSHVARRYRQVEQDSNRTGTLMSATPQVGVITDADRICIGHALVHNCSFERALSAIIEHAASNGAPAYVITPNAQHVVLLDEDPRLRDIYRKAELVVPDGVSMLLAARAFGRRFPERVAGVDLFQALCERAAACKLKVFLLGGRPGSADLASAALRERHPDLRVETYCPPLGFERDPAELNRIALRIREAGPHILFVAFGAPKQEYWMYEHGRHLGVNVCVGVGGSFEMVGRVVQRAPRWIQRLGCEWLHRLSREPRRMWRRYLIGNLQFLSIVFHQRLRRAVFSALVHVLKSSAFEAEFHDVTVRTETLDIMLRIAAAEHLD